MEELSPEELCDLEERLYSQIHHNSSTFSLPAQDEPTNSTQNKRLSSRYWAQDNRNNIGGNNNSHIVNKQQNPPRKAEMANVNFNPNKRKQAPPARTQPNKKVFNPFAAKLKHVQPNTKNVRNIVKTGPFVEKFQKLARVMHWNEKKQKSKKVHNNAAPKPMVNDAISLSSSSDSDSEVIHIPIPPPQVFVVEDSDEESAPATVCQSAAETQNKNKANGEKRFAKPVPAKTAPSPRCESPSSVMSHDDFIGQSDRRRLQKDKGGDNSLILSSNTDSLMEPPSPPCTTNYGEINISKTATSLMVQEAQNDSSDEIECTGTFLKPATKVTGTFGDKQNYRVDQSEFRAMDVYESESDIVSDGVYSKGAPRCTLKIQPPTTIIRNIDDSGESQSEDIIVCQAKMKRLRKRRASGSIRGSESNGGADSSDSDEHTGVAPTGVPFIARGPAVEKCKSKKLRMRTHSVSAARVSNAEQGGSGRMSDSEFMATLHSLAQGGGGADNNEDSETENITSLPTARDVAETVLKPEDAIVVINVADSDDPSTSLVPNIVEQQLNTCPSSSATEKAGDNKLNALDEAVPSQLADQVERAFNKIHQMTVKKPAELNKDNDNYFLDNTLECQMIPTAENEPPTNDENVDSPSNNDDNQLETDAIKYYIGYSPANNKCTSDGFGWNEEIRRFYNWSWGAEGVKEEEIKLSLNRDRRLWRILDADRFPNLGRRTREKCHNCLTFGHTRAKCPLPRKPLVCYMCGENGHLESRCPNTVCLRCGSKTTVYFPSCRNCMYWNNRICPVCKLRGHTLNDCPDKWRRYHSTTRPNVYPDARIVYNRRRYCCYCGRRGHLWDECRQAAIKSEYPLIASEIKSHEKSYEDVIVDPYRRPEIPCRLLFDPNTPTDLQLAEKTKPKLVYGRFLRAVGLQNLMRMKQKSKNINQTTSTQSNQTQSSQQSEFRNTTPEQVPEISEGQNQTLPEAPENTVTATENGNETTSSTERLQMPPPAPPMLSAHSDKEPVDMDSDSNYSFSDHFDVTTSTNSMTLPHTNMAPLPDFIPIGGSEDDAVDDENATGLGISARFVEYHSDDDDDGNELNVERGLLKAEPIAEEVEIACEAKIYVSKEHSKYLLSELGQKFLLSLLDGCDLKGCLTLTTVGYAAVIFGLPSNQEKFQREIQTKFNSLDESRAQSTNSSRLPKHVNTLIRFLRDSINLLFTNLGSAADLYKRLIELNKQNSKSGAKSADRVRRTLNMILLGQAGLSSGDSCFDALLQGLRKLVSDYEGDQKTPETLRVEIENNWRKLFTPFDHKNYAQLLLIYLKTPAAQRNRIRKLNIEPSLLGRSNLDVMFNKGQNAALNQCSDSMEFPPVRIKGESTLLLNVVSVQKNVAILPKDHTSAEPSCSNAVVPSTAAVQMPANIERKQLTGPTKSMGNQIQPKPQPKGLSSGNHKQQLEARKVQLSTTVNSAAANCDWDDTLLSKLDNQRELNSPKLDCTKSSMFWSRESLKFLTLLKEQAQNRPSILERLERAYEKAANGSLSYNNYIAITTLYNTVIRK